MRQAVFGGSFNPPHVGHVLAVAYVLVVHELDGVIVTPVYEHPFSKALAPFRHRVEMCRLAMGWLPGVEISEVEASLEAPSLTIRTLRRLSSDRPGARLRLVIGADVLHERAAWTEWNEIERLAPPITLGRAGHEHPDAPPAVLPDVSSTRVRELFAGDAPDEELAALVPRGVLAYARRHGLYR